MFDQDLYPFPQEKVQEADFSLVRNLQKWAEKEVISKRLEFKEDYANLLKPAIKKLFIDIGMQHLLWPEENGGIGQNTTDIAYSLTMAMEQIGRADTGIGYLYAATFALCSTFALQSTFNKNLCNKFAPLFCQDDRVVLGSLVLPVYGSRANSTKSQYHGKYLQAEAKKEGSGWVIEGSNIRPINSGADAQLYGILCSVAGEEEPAFFIIPDSASGLNKGEIFLKTGLAASRNAEIELRQVKVGEENLVFRGELPYRQLLSWLYLGMSAATVGSLFAVYEILKEWGDTRVIKGKGCVFKENPLTASLMAGVSQQILISRLLTHQLAQMLAQPVVYGQSGEDKVFVSALCAVIQVTQAAEKAINQSMELMGSAGYAKEWNLERYWRDIKTMQIHLGNRELNQLELACYFYQCSF